MNNPRWFSISLAVATALAIAGSALGAPVLSESFEGAFPPAGWTVVDNAGQGNNWARNDAFGRANLTGGAGFCADADSDLTCNGLAWDTELRSPSVALPAGPCALTFKGAFKDFQGAGEAWVDISSNGGATWTNLWYATTDTGPATEQVDLTAYAGQSVVLRWRYSDNADGCAWYWLVDDVAVGASGGPDLSQSTKRATDVAAAAGVATYTIVIRNTGAGATTLTQLTDPIPAGATYIPGTLSCAGGTGSCSFDADGNRVLWSGAIAAGDAVTVTFAVQPSAGLPCGAELVNVATLEDADDAPLPPAANLTAVTTVYDRLIAFHDFESGAGGFVAGQGEWQRGTPTYPAGLAPHSGSTLWGTKLDGRASDSVEDHLLVTTVTLPNDPLGVVLRWWDWFGADTSPDGVDQRFVYVNGVQVWTDPTALNQREWTLHEADLSAWAGQQVGIVFDLSVCCVDPGPDGWYLDDVALFGRCSFAALDLRKTAAAMARASDRVRYDITISNSGDTTASGALLADSIPAGTVYAPNSVACSRGICWFDAPTNAVYWTGDVASTRLGHGPEIALSFSVDVANPAACGAKIANVTTAVAVNVPEGARAEAETEIAESFVFYADFDIGGGGGFAFDPLGQWDYGELGGAYPGAPTYAHSQLKVLATNRLGGVIGPYVHATTKTLDLPAADNGLTLRWFDWFVGGPSDTAELTINGAPAFGYTSAYNHEYWVAQSVDLSPYAGQTVEIAFVYSAAVSGAPGWYIDDVAVVPGCPGLEIGPAQQQTGCPGESIAFDLTIGNSSSQADTIDITMSPVEWPATVSPESLALDPNSTGSVRVTVDVPWNPASPSVSVEVVATGQGSGLQAKTNVTAMASAIGSGWEPRADSLLGVRHHAVAYYGGEVADAGVPPAGSLFQIGGEAPGPWQVRNSVYRYDIAADTWTARTQMLMAVSGIDAAVIGTNIYVAGGSDDADDPFDGGTFVPTLQFYSPLGNSWSAGADMPENIAFASVVALGGKLYVIGGVRNNATYSDALRVYDPDANGWSSGAAMTTGRAMAAAGVIGGKIYVAGGRSAAGALDSLEIYDPVANSWSAGPSLPQAWIPFGDGVLDDRYLLVVGGGGSPETCSGAGFAFDTVDNAWKQLPALNRCLFGAQGDGDGVDYYLVGGQTNEGGSDHMSTGVERLIRCPACSAPVVAIEYEPLAPFHDSPTTFTAVFVSGSTPPDSYLWDFGDGTTATGQVAAHVYTSVAPQYDVLCTVANLCGDNETTTQVLVGPSEITPEDIIAYLLGEPGFTPSQIDAMDTNGDDKVDIADFVFLVGMAPGGRARPARRP